MKVRRSVVREDNGEEPTSSRMVRGAHHVRN